MSVDATQLEAWLRQLQTADAQINAQTAAALRRVQETLRDYATSIAHVQTGEMRDSIYALGPFPTGQGMLESIIASASQHAVYEMERGGDHDWLDRTIIEQSGVLDRLADECGRIVTAVVTG